MGFTCELDSIIAWSTPCSIWTVNASRGWRGPLPNETNVVITRQSSPALPKCDTWKRSGFNGDCFIIFKWMLRSSPSRPRRLIASTLFSCAWDVCVSRAERKIRTKKYKIRLQNNLAVDDTRYTIVNFNIPTHIFHRKAIFWADSNPISLVRSRDLNFLWTERSGRCLQWCRSGD